VDDGAPDLAATRSGAISVGRPRFLPARPCVKWC